MPRPRADGTPPRFPNKKKLTELHVRRSTQPGLTWDTQQRGLALQVRASGGRSYKVIYSRHNRVRWYTLGKVSAIHLDDARKEAARIMLEVIQGKDPQAEKRALRSRRGTFEELATRYVEEHAKQHNKSWYQADKLVRRHLLPAWGKSLPSDITRVAVKQLIGGIASPTVANQTLAAASAIFSWALDNEEIKSNPCARMKRRETESRERVVKAHELPRFWNAFGRHGRAGVALKLILLTGQRPGEVTHLRREHVHDGWWEMPGQPVPEMNWPGTKNGESHRVWLPAPAQDLVSELVNGDRKALRLPEVMHSICDELGIRDRVTPHDLRRSHGTKIAECGFDRHALNRIQNHRDGGIASVYDRHRYGEENRRIMEAVAAAFLAGSVGRVSESVDVPPGHEPAALSAPAAAS